MHDISNAEEVRDDSGTLIGYIKPATPELWVPIDTDRMTIAGPTYKEDAANIVKVNAVERIQPE